MEVYGRIVVIFCGFFIVKGNRIILGGKYVAVFFFEENIICFFLLCLIEVRIDIVVSMFVIKSFE